MGASLLALAKSIYYKCGGGGAGGGKQYNFMV